MKPLSLIEDAPIKGEFDWLKDMSDDDFERYRGRTNYLELPRPLPAFVSIIFFLSLFATPVYLVFHFFETANAAAIWMLALWVTPGVAAYVLLASRAYKVRLHRAIYNQMHVRRPADPVDQ